MNKIAKAIEANAGESLPDLREALKEAEVLIGRDAKGTGAIDAPLSPARLC